VNENGTSQVDLDIWIVFQVGVFVACYRRCPLPPIPTRRTSGITRDSSEQRHFRVYLWVCASISRIEINDITFVCTQLLFI